MSEIRSWQKGLATYARPHLGRSLLDVATSVVPYLALYVAMYFALDVSLWLALALSIPAGGFLLRTFIVFHDCTHGSFLPSKRANRWFGRFCALLVWQPFANWRHDHAVHHGTAGDLDRRGQGDVPTLTVDEYYAKSWAGRLAYRLFRNPLVMFGLGPLWSLMIGPRLTSPDKRQRLRNSVLLTNVALGVVIGLQILFLGWLPFLLVQMPCAMIAATAGVWLFYVQHQFEDVYWENSDDWSYAEAGLRGSSHLKLPKVLQFFTGNIGLHHVHHLNARIPNYNLQRAHDENPVFHDVPVLTGRDSLHCVRLKLIDTDNGRLVTFHDARAIARRAGRATAVTATG
jgi:acyl-lipid omega-6 desaturase (Delta-12 desaturase)